MTSLFQGDTSVVVLFVLCFQSRSFVRFVLFIFELSSGNGVAAYWEIVAHSAYDMFSVFLSRISL